MLENLSPIEQLMWVRKLRGSKMPDGYKKLVGLSFGAKTYYKITGFHLTGSDTLRVSFSVNKSCNVIGCYNSTNATDNYSVYMTTSGGSYLRYDGATYDSSISSARLGERLNVVITPNGTSGMPTDSVITPTTFTASTDFCVGTTSPTATSSKLDGNIWGDIVVDGKLKLVPMERELDNVLGYYDMVGEEFYEPIGNAPTSLGYA